MNDDTWDIPLSLTFIDYLAHQMDGVGFGQQVWLDQVSELASTKRAQDVERAEWQLYRLSDCAAALEAIHEVARLRLDLQERTDVVLADLRDRYRLISVIGMPRTGGSYLTAELLSSLGYEPSQVPAVLVHDGFPEIRRLKSGTSNVVWDKSVDAFAEYLVMARLFFDRKHDSKTIVIKKFPKAINCWDLVNFAFGQTEVIVTARDPLSCCVSTYEKAGGFPSDGLFRVRSTIEKWALRAALISGAHRADITRRNYVEVLIAYWKMCYIQLANSGALSAGKYQTVSFSQSSVESFAAASHARFRSGRKPTPFFESVPGIVRHPEWQGLALEAVHEVSNVWSSLGLNFPCAELQYALVNHC